MTKTIEQFSAEADAAIAAFKESQREPMKALFDDIDRLANEMKEAQVPPQFQLVIINSMESGLSGAMDELVQELSA